MVVYPVAARWFVHVNWKLRTSQMQVCRCTLRRVVSRANIWHIHLLSKRRPTPCVLDKITCCTAAVKKAPAVQAKGKGIAARRRCGLVSFRSRLLAKRSFWHSALSSRSSCVSAEPPVGVLAAACEVTASDNVIVCCGQGDEGQSRYWVFPLEIIHNPRSVVALHPKLEMLVCYMYLTTDRIDFTLTCA